MPEKWTALPIQFEEVRTVKRRVRRRRAGARLADDIGAGWWGGIRGEMQRRTRRELLQQGRGARSILASSKKMPKNMFRLAKRYIV